MRSSRELLQQVESQWREIVLSPYREQRDEAEKAIRRTYRDAGLAEPSQVIWLENPRDALIAFEVLDACDDSLPPGPLERRRTLEMREGEMRERLVTLTGSARWDAVKAWIGPHVEIAERLLPAAREILAATTHIRDSEVGAMEERLYRTVLEWNKVVEEAVVLDRGPLVGLVGCAVPLSGPTAVTELSVFDYLVSLREISADHPFRGLVDSFQNCFNWWAFSDAAVACGRHVEAHCDSEGRFHRTNGPAILFSDGWGVYAHEGRAIEQPPTKSEKPARGRKKRPMKDSLVLLERLPADPAARIERLRSHSPSLPFLDRYMKGEHAPVWRELQNLGPLVREDPYAADALAVSTETMRRVRANVHSVISKLLSVGYDFATEGWALDREEEELRTLLARREKTAAVFEQPEFPEQARKALAIFEARRGTSNPLSARLHDIETRPRDYTVRALVDAPGDIDAQIRAVEKECGKLPISLRAFYEIVGSVNLRGNHRPLNEHGETVGDPLVVDPLEMAYAAGGKNLCICEDACSKANFSGGADYTIALPAASMDTVLQGEPHELLFVDYLRLAFDWGGFAGWEGKAAAPKEIEFLREGMMAF